MPFSSEPPSRAHPPGAPERGARDGGGEGHATRAIFLGEPEQPSVWARNVMGVPTVVRERIDVYLRTPKPPAAVCWRGMVDGLSPRILLAIILRLAA